jgi:hypothetical protein
MPHADLRRFRLGIDEISGMRERSAADDRLHKDMA